MSQHIPDAKLFNPLVVSCLVTAVVVAVSGVLVPFPQDAQEAGLSARLVHNPFVLLIGFVGIWALIYGVIQLWASTAGASGPRFLGWVSGQGGGLQKAPVAADASLSAGLFSERWHLLSARRMAPISYAIWVLPLLGFIGTVVGISDAIGGLGTVFSDGDRQQALESVLGALRFAFDTTFAGLVLVIPVMALSTWLSLLDDRARERQMAQRYADAPGP